MSQKIFYLTTEITPFANTGTLGDYSAKVPLLLQEKGHDIRTAIPKYGYISERKYILREVIRLRSIPFEFEGEEVTISAKSAFIPKTRVQVYFLEDVDRFKPLSNLVYKSKNGRIISDIDERFAYFNKASLAILPHLFWSPELVMCNGWQSAFVPPIFKQIYQGEAFYEKIKTFMIIHSVDEYADFSRSSYDKAGIVIPESIKGDTVNAYEVAAHFADKIVVYNYPGVDNMGKLEALPGIKDHIDKISQFEWNDVESPDYSAIASHLDEELRNLAD
ncbi:MAG: glycogen/starch synthase [Candidatus Marinimicrobia bacterium]|nr:glycogen/starch synthase [Candidatus Neomarinimicrobiota bacterium]